jgi:type II secretory pathway pseudopilin PulG
MTNRIWNNLKFAFTIYEMAIVLVVIGVIAAMVVKGSAIIRTTEIKAELLKIDRIRSAIANFEQQNGRLPGDNAGRGIIITTSGDAAKNELYALASLSPNDFEAPYDNASLPLVWQFARCNAYYNGTIPSGYREIPGSIISVTDAREFVCIGLFNSSSNTFVDMPYSLIGGYELYFDDANTKTGVGRCAAGLGGCASNAIEDNKTNLRNYISNAAPGFRYFIRVW